MIFLPYFVTTVKMYIEILISILTSFCHCHDCLGPDGILLVYSLSYFLSPCCFKDIPSFQSPKGDLIHFHVLPQDMKFTCM